MLKWSEIMFHISSYVILFNQLATVYVYIARNMFLFKTTILTIPLVEWRALVTLPKVTWFTTHGSWEPRPGVSSSAVHTHFVHKKDARDFASSLRRTQFTMRCRGCCFPCLVRLLWSRNGLQDITRLQIVSNSNKKLLVTKGIATSNNGIAICS